MKTVWISILIRLMFGLVFLVYGAEKLIHLESRVDSMASSFTGTFLPDLIVVPFLYLLPFIEIYVGLAFLTGYRYKITLIVTGVLMTILTVGLAIRGEPDHVSRNLVYFFILLVGLWHSDQNRFCLFKTK